MTESGRYEQLLAELDQLQNLLDGFLETRQRNIAEKNEAERKYQELKKENEFLKFQADANQKELEALREKVLKNSSGLDESEKEELKSKIADAISLINNRLADGIKGE